MQNIIQVQQKYNQQFLLRLQKTFIKITQTLLKISSLRKISLIISLNYILFSKIDFYQIIQLMKIQFQLESNKLQDFILLLLYNLYQLSLFFQIHMQLTQTQLARQIEKDPNKKYILLAIFVGAILGFFILLSFMPNFSDRQRQQLFKMPKSPMDLFQITKVLQKYCHNNTSYVLFAFIYLYILLQAFAIPGPIFLCILSSPLFGAIPGFILSLSCSVLGASCCFALSFSLGKGLVFKYFPKLFLKFHKMVNQHKHNLLWYMLFLRLTPLIPNWFVNLGSPLVGMPYKYFFIGSVFGLIPNNFILIQTGMTLKEIEKIGFNPKHFIVLLILGFISLIPTLFKNKIQNIEKKYIQVQGSQHQ